jgi:hypothetical protein
MSAVIENMQANILPSDEASHAWNERAVQNVVYVHCALKHHEVIVPNSCLLGWESDVVSVNRTGFISEFEIKVSRADFKADAKKARTRLLINPIQKSSLFGDVTHPRPNYFFYVVPENLIQPEEVPDYAGLIYVERRVEKYGLYYGLSREVKAAKRLHKEKITEWQHKQLTRALTVRYWRQRLNNQNLVEHVRDECFD